MTASHACADEMPSPARLTSKAAASMLATFHPWRKAARSSSWPTLIGMLRPLAG